MLISRDWLQTFFNAQLPDAQRLADALTFHAFEIESVENDILDVKVTPNRGHDCLCHRGVAKELSAILGLPMTQDPLRVEARLEPKTDAVRVELQEPSLCRRYVAGYMRGVKVGPSPKWLADALESLGQRPINNIVDATNYVMFHLGQPLHAFDADKLTGGSFSIVVRKAKAGERMRALDEKEYEFTDSMLLITDGNSGEPLGIAGVKGGEASSITSATRDIILESANFDGVSVRKTAQALKLRTDASSRFEQGLSAELPAYGMRAVVELIRSLSGGEIVGFADAYPVAEERRTARVTTRQANAILGTAFKDSDIERALSLLDLSHTQKGEAFEVHVPFERLDLSIPEDLAEEVGRIHGYEHVPSVELPPLPEAPPVNADFARLESVREFLAERGFSEVYTSVFAEKGERIVLNKVDGVRPYLRSDIMAPLNDALEKNVRNKDLLGIKQVKLFEIGTVWKSGQELSAIELAVEKVKGEKSAEEYRAELNAEIGKLSVKGAVRELPAPSGVRYAPFSRYPFIVRDIALWVPFGTNEQDVLGIIRDRAGTLLVRSALFDRFEREGRVSLAFRLVFQSFDRTLTDDEVNKQMEDIRAALTAKEYEMR